MRNILRKWKLVFALTLSMAMLVVQMPLTVLAAPDETISAEEERQTGTIRDENTSAGEQSEEGSPEEGTDKDSEGEKGNEGESGKDAGEGEGETGKDTGDSEGELGKDAEDGEGEAGKDAEGGEEELGKDSEIGEVEADRNSEDEEETGEDTEESLEAEENEDEAIVEEEESVESAEEIMLSSASDFDITNGELKRYTGTEEDVEIPTGVVTIGKNAFLNNKTIKTVKFSSSVKTIETSAFYGCTALKEVTLNEGLVTIGERAFQKISLGEELSNGLIQTGTLVIPSTVRSIGGAAFGDCKYLGEVKFADGETEILELQRITLAGPISGCPMLTKIELPSRLKAIPEDGFRNNASLKEVIFGDKIETIGACAFLGCPNLNIVELKEGLVSIGERAFQGTALGEKLSNGLIQTGTLVIPSTVRSIGGAAFGDCKYLGEVKFADGETEILELQRITLAGPISGCPMLTKIELPSRLKVIPEDGFRNNVKLREVIFGNKLETIGANAFYNCKSLESADLPASVKTIGAYAFYQCSSLGKIDLKEGLITIEHNAFYRAALGEKNTATGTLVIPGSVQSIGGRAFCECVYLRKVIFASGEAAVLSISDSRGTGGAFGTCPELTTIIFPERITKLEADAVRGNKKLQTLYIPSNVTEIKNGAIVDCPKLTIYGVSGSAAETYAKQNNIPFKNQKPEIDTAVQSVNVTPGVIEEIGESAIGKKIQLTATVLPDTAMNRAVSYMSENETVATVDRSGLVTITGYGETRITVTTADGGKTASCRVVVSKEAVSENPDIKDATALFPKKAAAYSAIYTGEQIRPVMTVTYPYTDANGKSKTQTLKLNVDYTISYRNNVNVGQNKASVTVRGIGEYKGVITKTFTITPKSIQNVILSQAGDIVYGETPSVVVMDGTYELTKDKDYEVVLSTSGSANEDTQCVLTVKGMGNYTGTSKKSVKFNILKTGTDIQPIASKTISVAFKKLPAKGYTYNGKAQKPAVVVTDSNTGKKVAASNYKVIYTNNINAGTASVRVVGVSKKGKGYYGSSAPLTFEIRPKDFNKVKVSTKGLIPKAGTIEDMKKSVEEALTVKDGKHILSTDEYVIDYGNIRSTGDIKTGTKYPITLTAKAGGNYVAGTQKVFTIKFGQLSFASWTAKITVRIINAEQNEILLRYNGTLLEKGKDYTAVVKKDKNRDTYTVTIKAVKNGAYKGSKTFKRLSVD